MFYSLIPATVSQNGDETTQVFGLCISSMAGRNNFLGQLSIGKVKDGHLGKAKNGDAYIKRTYVTAITDVLSSPTPDKPILDTLISQFESVVDDLHTFESQEVFGKDSNGKTTDEVVYTKNATWDMKQGLVIQAESIGDKNNTSTTVTIAPDVFLSGIADLKEYGESLDNLDSAVKAFGLSNYSAVKTIKRKIGIGA